VELLSALRILLAVAAPSLAGAGAAPEHQRLVFGAELFMHPPAATPVLNDDTPTLSRRNLRPLVDEAALSFGASYPALALDVVLRGGYTWFGDHLPKGSHLGNVSTPRYTGESVPLTVGMRLRPFPWVVAPTFGAGAGVRIARAQLERVLSPTFDSGWSFLPMLRGSFGLEAALTDSVTLGLAADAQWSRTLSIPVAPDIDFSGFAFGLAVVLRIEPAALVRRDKSTGDTDLRDYGPALSLRLGKAGELIRAADEAKRSRSFIDADRLYRQGVGKLPRDPETRRNLEVPVRVEWAEVLVEIGQLGEARTVLREALEIDPAYPPAQALYQRIGH